MEKDMFLDMGDIKGESIADGHKEQIDLLSWQFGLAQAGSMHAGGGGGVGKAHFNDLTFTHYVDKASPNLMMACAEGKHLPKAVLAQRKSGGGAQEYLIVTMEGVIVTSVNTSDTANGGREPPTETVSLQFGKIDLEYKPQKDDSGAVGAGVHFKWDVKSNKKA
jgi:type VI secretion system secreted protein Hcp